MFFTESNSQPCQLFKYLNKYVNITQSDGTSLQGWVYTIDPVSLSVVLVDDRKEENKKQVILVMNDDITKLSEIKRSDRPELNPPNFDCLFQNESRNSENVQSLDSHIQKRDALVDWLVKNHLPVKLDSAGVINILDSVFIRSPYGIEQCESTNEIILERVRQLVFKT